MASLQVTGSFVNTTITTGGTAQTLVVSNTWQILILQNTSDTDMWLQFGATAAADAGIKIAAGTTFTSLPGVGIRGAISVIGATTGKKFGYLIK